MYINVSPPVCGSAPGPRLRSRSYDRNLDQTPPPGPGSLGRMLSCPVRLGDGSASSPHAPPRVTSFAEMARNKRRSGGSPSQRSVEASSGEFSPVLEVGPPPLGSPRWGGALGDTPGASARETRVRADGKMCCNRHHTGFVQISGPPGGGDPVQSHPI